MCRAVEELCREENKKGEKKGRKESQMETAQKMLIAGKLALEEIAEYSNLPLDEVRRLAKELPQ